MLEVGTVTFGVDIMSVGIVLVTPDVDCGMLDVDSMDDWALVEVGKPDSVVTSMDVIDVDDFVVVISAVDVVLVGVAVMVLGVDSADDAAIAVAGVVDRAMLEVEAVCSRVISMDTVDDAVGVDECAMAQQW